MKLNKKKILIEKKKITKQSTILMNSALRAGAQQNLFMRS